MLKTTKHSNWLLSLAALCVLFAVQAGAKATETTANTVATVATESIAAAQYAGPVERYGHFAVGRPHEYARLTVTTHAGRRLSLELPQDEVFEDITPRLVSLAAGEPKEILTIVSQRGTGSRLVLIRLSAGRLEVSAESPAIGTSNRWLNPVGVVDLDGDGRAEIAAVITPHIGGTLKIYRRQGTKLVELAAMPGFSNHINHTPEQGLSLPVQIAGQWRLLVPDEVLSSLRLMAWQGGGLIEVGTCAIPASVKGPIRLVSHAEVSVRLASGEQRIKLTDCLYKAALR